MSARPSSGLAARLLGREVLRRADDHVGAGRPVTPLTARAMPKSATTRVAVRVEQDVVGLDVAVDHALRGAA